MTSLRTVAIKSKIDPGLIYGVKYTTPTSTRSNRGGWQSPRFADGPFSINTSHHWMKEVLNEVRNAAECLGDLTYWFNINGPGNYNKAHHHGNTGRLMCGCLYIQVPKNSGAILFHDKDDTVAIEPNVGDLILFPDSLKHSVLENNSAEDRISIAFNFWRM